MKAGITTGFQWLAGSFLEDIEARESRAPRDLDVITCYEAPQQVTAAAAAAAAHLILADPDAVKKQYKLDHYFVDIAYTPAMTVESVRYWIGLFSHRRDGIWKGLVRVELNTPPRMRRRHSTSRPLLRPLGQATHEPEIIPSGSDPRN